MVVRVQEKRVKENKLRGSLGVLCQALLNSMKRNNCGKLDSVLREWTTGGERYQESAEGANVIRERGRRVKG